MVFLKAKGQVGYPPGLMMDARLGYPGMAYQSAEILFGSCRGDGSISVRPEASCMRAHPGAKDGLA